MQSRTINFNDYLKNQKRFSKNRLKLIAGRTEKTVRTRPRDPEEEKVLIRLTGLRWKRWQDKGIIKRTGERQFQVKIF
jgi:hypothetical protein